MTPPSDSASQSRLRAIGMLLSIGSIIILLLNILFSAFNFAAFSDAPPSSGNLLKDMDSDLTAMAGIGLVTGQFLLYKARHGRWPMPPLAALVIIILIMVFTMNIERAVIWGILLLLLMRRFAR